MDRLRNFGFLIKDIGRLYTRLFEYRASDLGVTLAQCKALVNISRNEGINQTCLAELSGIEPMSLVRILDRMETDGWIERRAHPGDRRVRQLYLKKQAQPTMEQLWKSGDAVRAQAFAGFKVEERSILIDLLERAHANLLEVKAGDTPAAKALVSALPLKKMLVAKKKKHLAASKTTSLRTQSKTMKHSKSQRIVR